MTSGGRGPRRRPTTSSWLAATVAGMLLAMAGLIIVPPRIGTRRPVAEALPIGPA